MPTISINLLRIHAILTSIALPIAFSSTATADEAAADKPAEAPLSAEKIDTMISHGKIVYRQCMQCHGPTGAGDGDQIASLNGSKWVNGNPEGLTRILLEGYQEGPQPMPQLGEYMSDEDLAALFTYIRQEWDNDAGPVTPEFIANIRANTGRDSLWTKKELEALINKED